MDAVTDAKVLVQLLLYFFLRLKVTYDLIHVEIRGLIKGQPIFTNEMIYDLHQWQSNDDLDQYIGLNMDLEQFITLNATLDILRQVSVFL